MAILDSNSKDICFETQTQTPAHKQLDPLLIVRQQHEKLQQQPQQWQYLHRIPSKHKMALGVNQRTGRVQWCHGLTCCKLLILLTVIMLPIVVILFLFVHMNGMLLGINPIADSPNEQEQSYYMDDYIDNTGSEAMDDIVSAQQFGIPGETPLSALTDIERLKRYGIVSAQQFGIPGETPLSALTDIERLKRCISFRFRLSEKDDNEDHDILKDARTSFLPLDTAAIPRECLEHITQGNQHKSDDMQRLEQALRKQQRQRRDKPMDSVEDLPTNDYEFEIEEDETSGSSSLSSSVEHEDDASIIQTVSALQSFWGDNSNKDNIRQTQANTMLKYMDPNMDPCQDFYRYSCGNWAKLHPIPRDKAGFDTFEMLRENLDLVLRDLLEHSENSTTKKRAHSKIVDVQYNAFDPHTNTQADIITRSIKTQEQNQALNSESAQLIKHILEKHDLLTSILRRYRRQTLFRRKQRSSNLRQQRDFYNTQDEDAIRKARDFYKSCIDTRRIQERGIQPLLSLINDFGGWPVLDPSWDGKQFDWLNLTAHLRRYNNDIFIVEWVGPDIKNSDENIIQFDQTSLGLPTREYFLQPINAKYLRAYQLFMSAIMQGLGAIPIDADKTANELISFETKLAAITSPAEQRLNVTKLYKRMTIRQLMNLVPQINWLSYLSTLQERYINDSEEVVIYALEYMQKLVGLIENTDKRIISNYLLWRFIRHRINNVDDRFEDSKQNFYHTLFGREESPSRWKICIAQVNTNMGMALGSLFVRKYFDENSKLDTLQMTHELQQAFRDILKTTNWLDSETKNLAELKVNAMSLKIGYPDFILNPSELNEKYKGIIIKPDKYFENTLNVLLHTAKTEQSKLHEPVNKTTWQTAPAIVNAYYSRNKNQIMFPAGILQPPFYHRHFPRSLNFGGIGVVIGHELTHGFDDKGRLFDRNGSIHKWWTDASIKGFDERARCIISQYGNYTVEEVGVTLNGESTQGENIADNGGIRQAFHAYKRWLKENPITALDERLPGINMTGEQLFFLNFGQVWCGAMRPEAVRNKLNTAIHSPGRFRVIGTVSNSEDFAREFNCPLGSPMNPVNKCSVW